MSAPKPLIVLTNLQLWTCNCFCNTLPSVLAFVDKNICELMRMIMRIKKRSDGWMKRERRTRGTGWSREKYKAGDRVQNWGRKKRIEMIIKEGRGFIDHMLHTWGRLREGEKTKAASELRSACLDLRKEQAHYWGEKEGRWVRYVAHMKK